MPLRLSLPRIRMQGPRLSLPRIRMQGPMQDRLRRLRRPRQSSQQKSRPPSLLESAAAT
jgi:hypothetical protein